MKNLITTTLSLILICSTCFAEQISSPKISGRISLMDIASNGDKLYLAYALEEESKQLRFQVYENNVWKEILLPADTKAAGLLELQIYNSVPYILFTTANGMTLIKYENGEWFQVGKPNFAAVGYDLMFLNYTIVNSIPYIILENFETKQVEILMLEKNGNLQVWIDPDASKLIPLNCEQPAICSDLNNSIYTAWFDRKNAKVQVSKLINEESELQDMSKGIDSKNVANLIGLKAIGNQLYLIYEDKSKGYATTILKYNSSASKWEMLTTTESMHGSEFSLAENLDVYMLDASKKPVHFKFENNGWTSVEEINSGVSINIRIASNGSTNYVAFLDDEKSETLIIQKY